MAAAKDRKQFVCSACNSVQLRWSGRCPECGEWNTLAEDIVRAPDKSRPALSAAETLSKPVPLATVARDDLPRLPLAIVR